MRKFDSMLTHDSLNHAVLLRLKKELKVTQLHIMNTASIISIYIDALDIEYTRTTSHVYVYSSRYIYET